MSHREMPFGILLHGFAVNVKTSLSLYSQARTGLRMTEGPDNAIASQHFLAVLFCSLIFQ